MKLNINTKPLTDGNAARGVGQYTRMLIEALKTYTDLELVSSEALADVVHYPFFDLFFLTLPLNKTKPTVVTIHDVIPLLYPKQYPKGLRGMTKLVIQSLSLKGVQTIVTDSDCSAHDVINYLKQPREKVATVYLAPDSRFKPASKRQIDAIKDKYALDKPYFLYVGDINYNKNLPELFRVFADLKGDYLLTLVSKSLRRDNPAAASLWLEIDRLGIETKMRILTDVPVEPLDELRSIYSGALWYVQPSLYEGFGLPVLEAQACECPVISTQGGSLKEIAGHSCLEFERFAMAEAVDRRQFIQWGLTNVRRFSWEKTASQMEAIYETVA